MTELKTSNFRFDDVRVEPQNFKVSKNNHEIQVEPKTFRLLLFFIENRARLIEKNELLDAVWKDAFVTENALTREIAKLRKALGDDSKTPKIFKPSTRKDIALLRKYRKLTARMKTNLQSFRRRICKTI